MSNFEAVIGLEIHVEMKTKSKMFSSAPNTYGAYPNCEVALLDMAFPGTMPVVNKQAVINGIRVAHALHMEIDHELWFDRKNYFYSDLPKGYQITQNERPIGKNGYLIIETSQGEKKIRIERIHLEEDTCKQLHFNDYTLIDYNRAGIPLAEIVSLPDMSSGEEAMRYVEKIRSIVSYLDVSDGKMEEGSLRCDVNISLKEKNSDVLGTKVEIKNLNSISNVKTAIDFEIKRQEEILLNNGKVIQETRRFDEASKTTVLMRVKTDAVDYKYFTEPNIPPIKLSDDFINEAIKTSNELADSKLQRYLKLGLSKSNANILVANRLISSYFDETLKYDADYTLIANWLIVDVQAYLNKEEIDINSFPIKPERLCQLVKLIQDGIISNKQAREVFNKMLVDLNASPKDIANSLGLIQISDASQLEELIAEVIKNNQQSIIDYKNGKDRALGYLVGQVMKQSKGKANPSLAKELVLKAINKE